MHQRTPLIFNFLDIEGSILSFALTAGTVALRRGGNVNVANHGTAAAFIALLVSVFLRFRLSSDSTLPPAMLRTASLPCLVILILSKTASNSRDSQPKGKKRPPAVSATSRSLPDNATKRYRAKPRNQSSSYTRGTKRRAQDDLDAIDAFTRKQPAREHPA